MRRWKVIVVVEERDDEVEEGEEEEEEEGVVVMEDRVRGVAGLSLLESEGEAEVDQAKSGVSMRSFFFFRPDKGGSY